MFPPLGATQPQSQLELASPEFSSVGSSYKGGLCREVCVRTWEKWGFYQSVWRLLLAVEAPAFPHPIHGKEVPNPSG